MAKFNLMENETLLGKETSSHVTKFFFLPQANPGDLCITNMRVVFQPTQGQASSAFAYKITDIESFSIGMANAITLTTNNGATHKITGMSNKKLIGYLQQAGVKKTS